MLRTPSGLTLQPDALGLSLVSNRNLFEVVEYMDRSTYREYKMQKFEYTSYFIPEQYKTLSGHEINVKS